MQYQQINMILKESTFAVIFILSFCFSQIKLNVNTIPKKVNIYLDGTNIGKSPINNLYINPGVHRFEIKKKGTSVYIIRFMSQIKNIFNSFGSDGGLFIMVGKKR